MSNPCAKHERQDVHESGSGFDCKICEIERLTAELDRREHLTVNMDLEHRATIEKLSAEVSRLREANQALQKSFARLADSQMDEPTKRAIATVSGRQEQNDG